MGASARALDEDVDVRLMLDHVVLAVPDLDEASVALERRLGLRASRGGRHPSLGTENALVPVGGAYVELVAVADAAAAAGTAFGRSALAARSSGARFAGWVARAESPAEGAVRMSRTTPDGRTITWRLAHAERLGDGGVLPPVITWDDAGTAPPFADPVHPIGRVRLDAVEIGDPGGELDALDAIAGVRVERAEPAGVRAVTVLVGRRGLVIAPPVFAPA
jgi:catechol 2,3-dioxygenase-like lactoylglutathione lyase family enzyme